jgi:DNA-binding XRE family transcriptional regulator
MTAQTIRRYRDTVGFSQERLAEAWGVSPKTIQRWEKGFGRPPEWIRKTLRAHILPENLAAKMLRTLVEERLRPAQIYDDTFKVLTMAKPHEALVRDHYKVDVIGKDWRKYANPAVMAMFDDNGGMRRMIKNGLMAMTGLYHDPIGDDATIIKREMYLEVTVHHIPDYGPLCVVMENNPPEHDDITPLMPFFMD